MVEVHVLQLWPAVQPIISQTCALCEELSFSWEVLDDFVGARGRDHIREDQVVIAVVASAFCCSARVRFSRELRSSALRGGYALLCFLLCSLSSMAVVLAARGGAVCLVTVLAGMTLSLRVSARVLCWCHKECLHS